MECVLFESLEQSNSAILEMKSLEDVPNFTVTKQKLHLPVDTIMDNFVCFLNTSIAGITMVLKNRHPLILNQGNTYRGYYYDALYLYRCIKSNRVKNIGLSKSELRAMRASRYGKMKSSMSILTPVDVSILTGKNFVYDLDPVTNILTMQNKLTKIPLVEKLKIYFHTIFLLYNQLDYVGYNKGPIFIDLDDYKSSSDKLNSYLFYDYLMLLLRKSDAIISRILEPIEDFQVVLYTTKGYIKFSKEDICTANRSKMNSFIKRLNPAVTKVEPEYDKLIRMDANKTGEVERGITNNFTGDDNSEDIKTPELTKDVEADKEEQRLEDKKAENHIVEPEEESEEEETELISDDSPVEDKYEYLKNVTSQKLKTRSEASLKRDKLLRERQMKLKLGDKTLGELVQDLPEPPKIEERKIDIDTTDNEELKTVKFFNFEKTYQEEMFNRDIARAITSFNDKSINVNVTNVSVEDTSTEMVFQDTYTIEFEDEYRRRHKMKVNIPKLVDNKFLILNGKKRIIYKQLVGLPIIKTGPDEVQICTNYNKLWLMRHGTRFNPNMERFKKMVLDPEKQPKGVKITTYKGSNISPNDPYATCLEYDELASKFNKIIIGDCTFVFSIAMLKEELGDKYVDPTLDNIIIGYRGKGTKKEPLTYSTVSDEHQDMVSFMIESSIPDYYPEFKQMSSGRKYVHTVVKIMEKLVPLVFVVTFFEGLSTVVKKFNDLMGKPIAEFIDKKQNDNYMYIQFADGYLRYPMNCLEACLLFNGYTDLIMKGYSIEELDDRDTYIGIFETLLGSGYLAGGFINYYDFMIDPKTAEILKLLHYPEDIVSLMIYASNLLADGSFLIDTDPVLYRLRDSEIIPAILYREMCTSYAAYRKTAANANPKKLTVDPDCIIKQLNKIPSVGPYSTLSPIVEVEQFNVASMKGFKGMNKDRSYNEGKRSYHNNMIGIVGISTDIAANTGKERHLVVEPNVVNAYGMFDVQGKEKASEMDFTKLMTPEEALYPQGVSHDDPCRTAMTSKQSCHAIPVKDQCPLLITNGYDSTIQYRTSNDFSYVAQQDGQVIDRNDDVNIMVIKYKDGTTEAIDLDKKIVQNGGGGIYLDNKLDTTFKKGDKFKKDAILAFDRHYYKDTGVLGNKMTYGTLVKTASIANFATYEDSMWSCFRTARALSADITLKEVSVVLGKNSNIDYIAKVGDRVINGDDLIRFDTSYNDAEMNELLNSIRSDLKEDIINLGRTKYTSKHDGIVSDIRVYPAIEPSEMSSSLRKVVNQIQKHDKDRRKFMDKYDSNKNSVYRKGIFFDRPIGMIEPDQYGKIGGDDVAGGVKIEIFVTYHDEVSDGDKFAHMSANKATNGYMIPRGFEPYTLFRPYEEIDIPDAPSAVLQRGIPSINTIFLGYKPLIELKRKLFELFTGIDWNEYQRTKRPYMDVHGKKSIKPVKESTYKSMSPMVVQEELDKATEKMLVLEDVFDLGKSMDGIYEASKEYSKGDIVLSGMNFKSPVNRGIFEEHLSTIEEGYTPNIELDETVGAYVATDMIFYGERFVLG